ncbi:MAG TPA: biotin transporter BioY [Sphaerochaeta sp.]|jgi:biotin transport system substrate-specific component|nr:biotin transporter BioY [Sphaerochaeta sp.]
MSERRILLIAFFTALIIVGSFIRIPLPPVPLTLQTLFALMAGYMGGPAIALMSVGIYLLLGAIGLPVFSGGGGFALLFGPTGGYLLALLPAALIASFGGSERVWKMILFGLLATIVIYLGGVLMLAYILSISFAQAIVVGVLPFLIGDGIKLGLAIALSRRFSNRVRSLLA